MTRGIYAWTQTQVTRRVPTSTAAAVATLACTTPATSAALDSLLALSPHPWLGPRPCSQQRFRQRGCFVCVRPSLWRHAILVHRRNVSPTRRKPRSPGPYHTRGLGAPPHRSDPEDVRAAVPCRVWLCVVVCVRCRVCALSCAAVRCRVWLCVVGALSCVAVRCRVCALSCVAVR